MKSSLQILQKETLAQEEMSRISLEDHNSLEEHSLRQNYDENMIFDDNSDQFTGIGRTYTLKVNGIDTTGVSPGMEFYSLMVYSKTPSTENNTFNYDLIRDVLEQVFLVLFILVLHSLMVSRSN